MPRSFVIVFERVQRYLNENRRRNSKHDHDTSYIIHVADLGACAADDHDTSYIIHVADLGACAAVIIGRQLGIGA